MRARKDYATWFFDEASDHRCVYVDEMNFNMWTSRTQGRSKRGLQCFRTVNGQRG